jgi:hypothetical protein
MLKLACILPCHGEASIPEENGTARMPHRWQIPIDKIKILSGHFFQKWL